MPRAGIGLWISVSYFSRSSRYDTKWYSSSIAERRSDLTVEPQRSKRTLNVETAFTPNAERPVQGIYAADSYVDALRWIIISFDSMLSL